MEGETTKERKSLFSAFWTKDPMLLFCTGPWLSSIICGIVLLCFYLYVNDTTWILHLTFLLNILFGHFICVNDYNSSIQQMLILTLLYIFPDVHLQGYFLGFICVYKSVSVTICKIFPIDPHPYHHISIKILHTVILICSVLIIKVIEQFSYV